MTPNPIPKIYCLTIPGTPRHIEAAKQLDNLGMEYEFIFGKVHDPADIPWDGVKGIRHDNLYLRYPVRCWGCKKGHIDLLRKALADNVDYCISCEDDLWFEKCDWSSIPEFIDELDSNGGILNLGSNAMIYDFWFGGSPEKRNGRIISSQWATDTVYLLNREGMKYYLKGLESWPYESDISMCHQLASDNRKILSLDVDTTPIVLNPEFYTYSNIL